MWQNMCNKYLFIPFLSTQAIVFSHIYKNVCKLPKQWTNGLKLICWVNYYKRGFLNFVKTYETDVFHTETCSLTNWINLYDLFFRNFYFVYYLNNNICHKNHNLYISKCSWNSYCRFLIKIYILVWKVSLHIAI